MPEIDRWKNDGGGLSPPRHAARLQALQRRHAHLDNLVQTELKRSAPCAVEPQHLRREERYLRDEKRTQAT